MLAALVLAVLPIGAWPIEVGPSELVVDQIEFYTVEPEENYAILAVQPLSTPLTKPKNQDVRQLVRLAKRLGADAVLLLAEVQEKTIPEDLDEPLPTTGRYVSAVFLVFEDAEKGKNQTDGIRHSMVRIGSRPPGQRTLDVIREHGIRAVLSGALE